MLSLYTFYWHQPSFPRTCMQLFVLFVYHPKKIKWYPQWSLFLKHAIIYLFLSLFFLEIFFSFNHAISSQLVVCQFLIFFFLKKREREKRRDHPKGRLYKTFHRERRLLLFHFQIENETLFLEGKWALTTHTHLHQQLPICLYWNITLYIKLSCLSLMQCLLNQKKGGKKKRKEKGNLNKKKACIEERKKNRRGKGKFGQLLIYDGEWRSWKVISATSMHTT